MATNAESDIAMEREIVWLRDVRDRLLHACTGVLAAYDRAYEKLDRGSVTIWSGKDVDEMRAAVLEAVQVHDFSKPFSG